jgi:hypothetical protein
MIKYRTKFGKIEAVEIERETDKQIVHFANKYGHSRRENKVSDWLNWHDTWDDAHKFLIEKAERSVECCRLALMSANEKLVQINGMEEPE